MVADEAVPHDVVPPGYSCFILDGLQPTSLVSGRHIHPRGLDNHEVIGDGKQTPLPGLGFVPLDADPVGRMSS